MPPLRKKIRQALILLESLESANKTRNKEQLLEEGKSNEILVTLVMMAIGPDRYHIKPSEDLEAKSTSTMKITAAYRKFLKIAEQLNTRQLTGNAASKQVEDFLISLYPIPKKWFTRVLNKNLRIGVSEKTLRKVWGDEAMSLSGDDQIIFFKDKCPLAEKYEDLTKKKSWNGIDFGESGWYSEAKLDGDRALLFVFPSEERIVVLTRGGKRWRHIETCEPFVDRMLELHEKVSPYTGFGELTATFYDGEFFARSGSWNETASIIRSRVNFDEEKFLTQVRILLWDWCPLEAFNAGQFRLSLAERKYSLLKAAGVKKRTRRFTKIVDGIYVVGHAVVYTEEEMWKDNSRKLARGFEGSMLKNPAAFMSMKRTEDIIKIKPTDQATGTIVKLVGGKGKHAAAKKTDLKKVQKAMDVYGDIGNDGYYLHCDCGAKNVPQLIKELQEVVNDSNDRRISCHLDKDTVSYRYSERLGYFVVKTEEGERIRVGGKMTFRAGNDQLMEYWMRREELIGTKVDFLYQGGTEDVAKARFNKFYRLREDL